MFDDTPEYSGPEGGDIPLGTIGAEFRRARSSTVGAMCSSTTRAIRTCRSSTPTPSPRPSTRVRRRLRHAQRARGQDRPAAKRNLAYISYYNAGARVVKFKPQGHQRGRLLHRRGWQPLLGHVPAVRGKRAGRCCCSATGTAASTSSATPGRRPRRQQRFARCPASTTPTPTPAARSVNRASSAVGSTPPRSATATRRPRRHARR